MNTDKLSNPIVKAALTAINARDREGWYSQFADKVKLTDDGHEIDFTEWADDELFGEGQVTLISIDSVEDDGLNILGTMNHAKWGEFQTYLRFTIKGDKITRLDVGQVEE